MNYNNQHRRSFLKNATKASGAMMMMPLFAGAKEVKSSLFPKTVNVQANRIKFAVININHNHIYGMVRAVINGGGELVGVYAKEPELLAGFKKAFPNCKHYGCHFHYNQCLRKHSQKYHLNFEYLKDESVHKWIRLFSILPFVPNDQVTKAYNLIINHKPKFVEQTTATNIKLFADYVKDTWIVD
jgi:hypothetical protein